MGEWFYDMEAGKIHIYYGDGKGKSTAAFGLALRAIGHNCSVVAVQFLKSGDSGEVQIYRQLQKTTYFGGMPIKKFTFQMTEEELLDTRVWLNDMFKKGIAASEKAGILILDEIIDAYELNLLDHELLHQFLQQHPSRLEIIMTGHSLPRDVAPYADYITCMKKEKHPYDSGIPARMGIEF